jgi:hypothetical protein
VNPGHFPDWRPRARLEQLDELAKIAHPAFAFHG